MKTTTLLLVLATAMGGLACASKDAVLTTGSGGGGGNPGSGGVTTGSGGHSASGGHAGSAAGEGGTTAMGGAPGHGGTASGGVGSGGHGGSVGSGGVGGGSPPDGGADAFDCHTAECARPYECVRACGGTVESTGCCQCVAPLFDSFVGCMGSGIAGGHGGAGGKGGAGGTSGAGGAGGKGGAGGAAGVSCGQLQTDYAAAVQKAKSCAEAISSRYPCDTYAPAALGCPCTTVVDDATGLQAYQDAWTAAGCSVVCTLACVNAQKRNCDTTGSSVPGHGACRDTP